MENQHINESILSEEILEYQKKNRIDHMKYMPGMEDIGSEILDQVVDAMHAYDYDKYTAADVKQAIAHSSRTPEDFLSGSGGSDRFERRFYHRQHCLSSKRSPRQHRLRQENILETASICSHRSILRIIVKIIAFTVDSTVIIRSNVPS